MQFMGFKNNFSKQEKIALTFLPVAAIFCVLLLVNDDLFENVFGILNGENISTPIVGRLDYQINDTRHRSSTAFVWKRTRRAQNIRLDDSLFTGENSQAQVVMKEGNKITLDSNSLVTFRQISGTESFKIPYFSDGNFKLQIQGKMTIAVAGKQTVVEGKNAEVQVFVKKNQAPQIRLLKGSGSLKEKGHSEQTLQPMEVVALKVSPPERNTASTTKDVPLNARPAPNAAPIWYTYRLYDIYEMGMQKTLKVKTDPVQKAEGRYLSLAPQLTTTETNLTLKSEAPTSTILNISGENFSGYVLEISQDANFPVGDTTVQWTKQNQSVAQFKEVGHFYYRVRGVNEKTELTAYSNTQEIQVEPEMPRLAGMTVQREQIQKPAKKISRKTSARKIAAVPQKTKSEPRHQEKPKRKPSSIDSTATSAMPNPPPDIKINQGFSSSKVAFESGLFSVYSPDEADIGRREPVALSWGLRVKHWFSKSGVEAGFRMKAADQNSSAKGIDPLTVDARYHYQLPWFHSNQVSIFGGYEMYRNIGTGYFAQKYDLVNLGFSTDFPVGSRWDMGGEALLGLADDKSRKYQLSGRLHYYLKKNWTAGLGYRLYYFEAGSAKTAPLEYPYKEAYGEGFFSLEWHY